jgi:hypothetical protein
MGELISMQGRVPHQDHNGEDVQPEREERLPFQDDDDPEPGGFERITRNRPPRPPRENDGRGRRPNRSGKPLW